MIYYTSRDLSRIFNIKKSRWKRWSREFLPPDPLGGLQSGYARQYTSTEAFIVYLGGNLVSRLQFSIPDTRMILKELDGWLNENGFTGRVDNHHSPDDDGNRQPVYYEIWIFKNQQHESPVFQIRETFAPLAEKVGYQNINENPKMMPPTSGSEIMEKALSVKVLFITKLLLEFTHRLQIDKRLFPALNPFLPAGD